MTNEAANIAVAEHLGWSQFTKHDVPSIILATPPTGTPRHPKQLFTVPNYGEDLNAMHEAEKTLTREQQREYTRLLHPKYIHNLSADWCVLHATAAQRAEAFLRTVGKWVETK